MLTCSPVVRDCIQGVCEVSQQAEGQFREVDDRVMLGVLGVPLVEFGYKPLCTFDIFRWPPFILFDPISFPTYEISELPLEDLAVQDALYFLFLNSITDYGGWQDALNSFSDGICIVGS